jgi:hypothetical protein
MKKLVAALAALLVLAAPVFAINIPRKCMVSNRSPGYCVWASLETLGWTHHIKPLYNLTEARTHDPDCLVPIGPNVYRVEPKNLGYDHAIRSKLDGLKVRYRMQNSGGTDRGLLKYAKSHGCVVGMKNGACGNFAHAIVLVNYDDEKVQYYDSNYPGEWWEGSRAWFDYYWTGMVIVVEK